MSGRNRYPRRPGPHVEILCRLCGKRGGEILVFNDGTVSRIIGMGCRKHGELEAEGREIRAALAEAIRRKKRVRVRATPIK